MQIPDPALILLVGAPASGKSTWAHERYASHQIVSLDELRERVADDPADMEATEDAMAIREAIVQARLRRGRTTVADSTHGRQDARGPLIEAARAAGMPVVAVLFPLSLPECQRRNAARSRVVPAAELAARWAEVDEAHRVIADEVDQVVVVTPRG